MIIRNRKKSNYIFLIIHSIIVVLLCSVYLNKFITPKIFPYLGIVAILFPILLIIHVILTFIWLLKEEIVFIFFMLFTGVLFFPLKKYIHFGNNYTQDKVKNKSHQLKILTYNIRYANNSKDLRALEQYIIDQDIDIAFFQEIYTRQWRSKETFLADRYNAVFDLVGISSKYPIINKQKIILPGNGYACSADIQTEKSIIRCLSIYLEPMFLNKNYFKIKKVDEAGSKTKIVAEKLTTGFKKHQVQIDLLTKYIQESPHPVIICGDFNSVPLSYEYFALKQDMQDVFELSGKGLGMTFYDYFYPIRIDYIFTSSQFLPLESFVNTKVNYSDHNPVTAVMEIEEN